MENPYGTATSSGMGRVSELKLRNTKGKELLMVAVVDLSGRPLMPTNEYRARKLLKQKKAKIFGYRPFTIQLTERKSTEIQPIELCMDTGYIHIGISAKSERHEYLGMQIDTLTDEKLKRDDKRQYRRQNNRS